MKALTVVGAFFIDNRTCWIRLLVCR